MNGLTKRQAEVLSFIRQFINEYKFSPSLHEIKDHFGFASANSSAKHLATLKQKGFLISKANCSRSISFPAKPIPGDAVGISLPLVGKISAGKSIEIFAEIEFIHVTSLNVASPELVYLLQVQDSSFHDEMLLEDDLLVVEANSNPKQGNTIIAIVNQQNTLVGRYFCDGDQVKLMSLSYRQQPISLHPKDLTIQGIVISSIRNYESVRKYPPPLQQQLS